MARITNIEYLMDNFISSGLRKALQPMNFIQSIFIMSSYRTQDNFITPHGPLYYTVSVLSKLFLSFFFVITFMQLKYDNAFVAVNVIYRIGCIFAYIVLIISNIVTGKINVNLLKEIQKVVCCLKYDESLYPKMARENWFLVSVFVTTYIAHFLYCAFDHFLRQNGYHGTLVVFDAQIIYAASIIRIITSLVDSLIDKVKSCNNLDGCDKVECDFVHIFKMILHVYDLFQTVYRLVVRMSLMNFVSDFKFSCTSIYVTYIIMCFCISDRVKF